MDRIKFERKKGDLEEVIKKWMIENEILNEINQEIVEVIINVNPRPLVSVSLGKFTEKELIEIMEARIIDVFNFSPKLKSIFWQYNVVCVKDLVELSETELLRMRNLGQISLKEIRTQLKSYGLSLKY